MDVKLVIVRAFKDERVVPAKPVIQVVQTGVVVMMASETSRRSKLGKLCYFIIKYFDKFEQDYTVGLGGMKQQIWFIPDDLTKRVAEADESTLKIKIPTDTTTTISFGSMKNTRNFNCSTH